MHYTYTLAQGCLGDHLASPSVYREAAASYGGNAAGWDQRSSRPAAAWVGGGLGGWRKWGDVGQRVWTFTHKMYNSVAYSLVAIVNSTVLYVRKLLRS